jgi:ATP-dependent DNA helicase DinG
MDGAGATSKEISQPVLAGTGKRLLLEQFVTLDERRAAGTGSFWKVDARRYPLAVLLINCRL